MNSLKRFLPVLVLLAFGLSSAFADSMVDQLYRARAYELADSYWAAGQRFIQLGQKDRGAQFQARALQIFPGYVPGQAPSVAPVPAKPAPQLPAEAVVLEKNLQGEKITRLQFEKLLRGYLLGDAALMASVLAPTVQVQGQSVAVTADALSKFLQDHPVQAGSPDDLFQIGTMTLTDGQGQKVSLTIEANPEAAGDLASSVPFWKPQQTYLFDRDNDTWKLVSVSGQ